MLKIAKTSKQMPKIAKISEFPLDLVFEHMTFSFLNVQSVYENADNFFVKMKKFFLENTVI